MKVRLEQRVVSFVRTLPPETRRKIDAALTALEKGHGDILGLEAELAGFSRLRVGAYRIIYRHATSSTGPEIVCELAQRRNVVYEMFAAILTEEGII